MIPVDAEIVVQFCNAAGISRKALIDIMGIMGGSP
jgi:hypothetical protein